MNSRQIEIKNKLEAGVSFKISRFKEQIKKTNPHKHDDYYELIFLGEGEGFHCVESEKYMIAPPESYSLKPGQLHYWQFTSIPKGFVILFKETELDVLNETDLQEFCRQLSGILRIRFKPEQYPGILLEEILSEYNKNLSYSRSIIHGLFRALLGRLLQTAEELPPKTGIPLSVYERFRQLLIKECPGLRKVSEFASLLNTTPQNLNAVCRKKTGNSAGEIISDRLLLEAKRYILHTDNTINEIAEILSFPDTSNFVKFFRKAEGLTPVQFREKHLNDK